MTAPTLSLPRPLMQRIVNASLALVMGDSKLARDTAMKLLVDAFAEANDFAEQLDGRRLCLRCDRPVDKDGVAHPLGSSGQICMAYGHVFDEAEPKPSPWANTGKLIDAAELAGKVGTFEDLVKLCLDPETDTGFYAISEGNSVFCFSDDTICELFERIEKAEQRFRSLEAGVEAGASATAALGEPEDAAAIGNLVRDRRKQIARVEELEGQLTTYRENARLAEVEFKDMVKRLEDASREHERLDYENDELAKTHAALHDELTERNKKVETAYAILRDAAQDFMKHIVQRMGYDKDNIPVPDRVWIALFQHALGEPWPTGTNYIVERAEVEGGMHVQRLHQRVAKAEHEAKHLRMIVNSPDPAPCRNCGRLVLAGPACCEKPDIPPYETPIADLIARVEAAEERAAKLASDLMMEKLRREGVERDLERVSRGEDDEEVIAHDSAEIGALKVELAQTKELLAGLTPVGKTFVSCTGTPGSDGRCQECGQMVANSAGTHMRLVGG